MIKTLRDRMSRSDEGFTLVELLIVIVVLGILAAIVVFGVSTFRSDSENAACKSDRATVEVAAEAYNAKTGGYPPAGAVTSSSPLVTGKYLKSAPSPAQSLDANGKGTNAC